jgi:hypothetical protein|eukprot:SAG11_NODE_3936_length_2142_cov_10.044053_1_plen_54_part_00
MCCADLYDQVFLSGQSYEQDELDIDAFDKYTGGFDGSFADTVVRQAPISVMLL